MTEPSGASVPARRILRRIGVFSLTLLTLITAVLLAIHRGGKRRAFWLGFALFGGSYLIASLIVQIPVRSDGGRRCSNRRWTEAAAC